MNIKPGTVVSGILVAVAGYAAYKFYKGEWSLPALGAAAVKTVLPGDIGRGAVEGAVTGGIPGAAGGIVYNIFAPPETTLGERIIYHTEEPEVIIGPTITEETGILPGDITSEQIQLRAVMQETAKDVTAFPSYLIPIVGPAYTIGAGLGAIKAETLFKETLTPGQKYSYEQAAWERRGEFMATPAGIIAQVAGFGIPTLLQHTIWKPTAPPPPTKTKVVSADLKPAAVSAGPASRTRQQIISRAPGAIKKLLERASYG